MRLPWAGMGVYKSSDLDNWTKQDSTILAQASKRADDQPSGGHGDVVVVDDKAYIFYFTHPEREKHGQAPLDQRGNIPYQWRRSSIQVAELIVENGQLKVKDRDQAFKIFLPNN